MLQVRPLIDLYIDANIILVAAFGVWWIMRALLNRTSAKRDHTLLLHLSQGLLIAVVASPIIANGLLSLNAAFFPAFSLNAADFAVAQFLDGNVSMKAEKFEGLLLFRANIVDQIAGLATPMAKTIAAVAAIGFVGSLAWTVWNIARLRRLIGRSYKWRTFGSLHLRLSDEIHVPFSTRSLSRRFIVVPSSMLTQPEQLRITLAHELQHMRCRDTDWELLLVLLRPFFFWNPAFIIWKRNLENMRELSCDQVLLQRRKVSPRAYADCLIAVCENSLSRSADKNVLTPSVPLLDAQRRRGYMALRSRITAITSRNDRLAHSRLWLCMTLTVAALAVAVAASSIRKPADWSQDRLMLSTIVNLERLEGRSSASISLANY